MSNPVIIIMIEDDEGHARLIERNIRRSGVNNEIIPFTNGTAALEYLFGKDGTGLAHKGSALLILLDLNLPDTTGIDILKRVKENKYLKSTPVVVLTTTDDSHEIKRCYELGCNVYITKPVNYESFANAIRQLGLFLSVMAVSLAKKRDRTGPDPLHRRRCRPWPADAANAGGQGPVHRLRANRRGRAQAPVRGVLRHRCTRPQSR